MAVYSKLGSNDAVLPAILAEQLASQLCQSPVMGREQQAGQVSEAVSAIKRASSDVISAISALRGASVNTETAENKTAYEIGPPAATPSVAQTPQQPASQPGNNVQALWQNLNRFVRRRPPMVQPGMPQRAQQGQSGFPSGSTPVLGHQIATGPLGLGPGSGSWDNMQAPGGITPKVAQDKSWLEKLAEYGKMTGIGAGKGRPGGGRRLQMQEPCSDDGPGEGQGEGRGKGKNRRKDDEEAKWPGIPQYEEQP